MTSNHHRITCVAATGDICAEGVVWHPEHECIYWTDINRHHVHRVHWNGGSVFTWKFDQPATALTITEDPDLLLLVLGGRIVLWSPRFGEVKSLYSLPEWPLLRCNDAHVSPAGSLWFGTMQNNVDGNGGNLPVSAALGQLVSLRQCGESRVWDFGFGITNTVCWSSDKSFLLFGDTLANAIYKYPYTIDQDSIDLDRSIFCEGFARGLPDGSTIDSEGNLWNCRYSGGCIVRFAPDGKINTVMETPVVNPTTCIFGGPELQYLYFTSAQQSESSPLANDGGLFRCRATVPGTPSSRFRL